MAKQKTQNHQPVFTANPLAKPLNWLSYIFPNQVAQYLDTLWSTPIKMGKGLYANKLKSGATHKIETGVTPIYGYGNSDKHIVLMHGWNARGGQLRKFIEPLVKQGFCVWWFDAPGFGVYPAKKSSAYRFAQTLIDVQQQISQQTGQPIYGSIAHSLGCLATILASDPNLFKTPYQCSKMAWVAPSLSPNTMFDSYCDHMQVRDGIKKRLYDLVGQDMQEILHENPWTFFEKDTLFDHMPDQHLLMFDHNDEEVLQADFENIEQRLKPITIIKTDHLGHYHMLKDPSILEQISTFMSSSKDL
ncbi:MAG: alpha/beta hydrolase [Saccharospirillaceae bacterium]|nr:alpha/beta hydrolase [Pseudomonadales bacterium]NRB80970.1 alpha/beta hydrolase [Saccharospirillaceae bacterium]